MSTDGIVYMELVVDFEEETALQAFPHLGMVTLLGHMATLLEGSAATGPLRFIPAFAGPGVRAHVEGALEEGRFGEVCRQGLPSAVLPQGFDTLVGIRMCAETRRLLKTPAAERAGLQGIAAELTAEVNALSDLLVAGGRRGRLFTLDIRRCEEPPASLVAWMAETMTALWQTA